MKTKSSHISSYPRCTGDQVWCEENLGFTSVAGNMCNVEVVCQVQSKQQVPLKQPVSGVSRTLSSF